MTKSIKQTAKQLGILYDAMHALYRAWLNCKRNLHNFRHRERRRSYGEENPDKIFYVIGVAHTTGGLFAIVKSVFCHICYAVDRGYIPVVDMKNFASQLSDRDSDKNAWELFFEQPGGYTLEAISRSKNIVLSASLPYPKGVEIGFNTVIDRALHEKYHRTFNQFIRPCGPVKAYLEKKYEAIMEERGKVLGVLCRGTDYTESRPVGHPIQPTKEQALQKVQALMKEHGFNHVFLATEDERYFNHFKQELGEKLLFSGQKLYSGMNGHRFLSEIKVDNYSEKWHNIVDYYATIHILSKCDSLLAGLTCGSICAYLMSDGYNYRHIWNLGVYE